MAEVSTTLAFGLGTRRSRAWLLAALAFVAVRALPNLSYPMDRDQATYCVIARGLLGGQQLYRDLWDNKPPGIFYIYTLTVKLFGPVMWGVGLVDILVLLVSSFFVFRFAELYLGSAPAALAVAFNAEWHCQAEYTFAGQPETFVTLFVLAGFFLMAGEGHWLKLRQFAAGVMLGAAFWTKYNALVFLPFLLLLPYLETSLLDGEPRRLRLVISGRQWFSRAMVFTGGFALVTAMVLVHFWIVGAWPAFKEVQFEVLPRYLAVGFERTPHYWLWAALRTQQFLGLWVECATLASLSIAWQQRELGCFAPLFLAAAMSYVSLASQARFQPYYFETCYPFFATFWGYLGAKIYQAFRSIARSLARRSWRLARALVWVVFANVVYWPIPQELDKLRLRYEALREWWTAPEVFYANYDWPHPLEHLRDQFNVIHYLKEQSTPADSVFVWGTHPLIYHLSGRRLATRFVSNLVLISPWGPPPWREELVRDLEKSPPRFVVVARRDWIPSISYSQWDSERFLLAFPRLAAFIRDQYRPVATFDDFVIYRRQN